MMIRVKILVAVHVLGKLQEYSSLKYFAQDRKYSHWSIILAVKFASFTFIQRDHFCYFPLGWKLVVLN